MPQFSQIAILGGGPAGAICGERLARKGFDVTIYDEHLAWEKPCGGGLTHKAIVAYPFLFSSPEPKKLVNDVEMIASNDRRAKFRLDDPIVIYSRKVLNGLLLDRAEKAGCKLIRARVTRFDSAGHRARVEAEGIWRETDFAVIAAGARNSLLPLTEPLPPQDLELTYGYYIPVDSNVLKVKFVGGLEGYLWSFPRLGHLSVGICGNMARHKSPELRSLLDQFVVAEKLDSRNAEVFSHVLPSPRAQTLRGRSIAGPNWALIGDAAALVDTVTGEGIFYAMRSGEILAECMIEGNAWKYPERSITAYRKELEMAASLARRFYHGKFLGGAVTNRMIDFARHSTTFRQLLADIFAGSQSYRTLKSRLWVQLAITLGESVGSLVRGHPEKQLESQT